jgi:hypothetical protein
VILRSAESGGRISMPVGLQTRGRSRNNELLLRPIRNSLSAGTAGLDIPGLQSDEFAGPVGLPSTSL